MSNHLSWQVIADSFLVIGPFYQEATGRAFRDSGFQGGDWGNCFLAYGLEPQPLTAEFLHAQVPYTNLETQKQSLAATAERGFLTAVAPDSYHLSESGRKGIVSFFEVAVAALSQVEPLPTAELDRLATLLHRVVKATLNAAEPTQKSQLHLSRRTDPGMTAHPMSRVDQYTTDLSRYRDDAHLAAWSSYGVSGPAWEAFTFLWWDGINAPSVLAERLTARGHSAEDYAVAFQELVGRGWVTEQDDVYLLTENGRTVRETAESLTDTYSFVGWSALNEAEQAELTDLLTRFCDQCREQAADLAADRRTDLWPLASSISGSLSTLTRAVVNPISEGAGINQRGLPFTLFYTHSLHPEPVSGEAVLRRLPYGTAESWERHMAQLAEKGLLVANGDGAYHLSENGRILSNQLLTAFRQELVNVTAKLAGKIETAELERLAELLGRVIAAALEAPEPPGAQALRYSRNLAPADGDIALSKIDQSLDDLNAFRDDSHNATFRPQGIAGHAWELFTFLWRGEAKNALEMAEKAAHRGHSAESYTQVLGDLAARGWVTAVDDTTYQVTETGQSVRQQAETLTNRYFYAPWTTLNNGETQELRDLLTRLDTGLKQLIET